MSNPEPPGGDPSSAPSSPPEAWAEDPTVVVAPTPFPAPPGSDPSPFDAPAPPPANPLPPSTDPFSALPPGVSDAPPWTSGAGAGQPPYQAPPFGAAPPPGLGAGPPYGSVPPPGYVPTNPYAGTPYDAAPPPAAPFGAAPFGAVPYGGGPYGAVPYGGIAAPARTGIAVGSLVCGVVGLVVALVPIFGLVGGLFALVAIPLGFIGLGAAKRQGGAGRGLAIGGIVTGGLAIVVCLAWLALLFLVGTTVEEDPYYNSEPMDGFCETDRYWEDPDC